MKVLLSSWHLNKDIKEIVWVVWMAGEEYCRQREHILLYILMVSRFFSKSESIAHCCMWKGEMRNSSSYIVDGSLKWWSHSAEQIVLLSETSFAHVQGPRNPALGCLLQRKPYTGQSSHIHGKFIHKMCVQE